MVKRTPAMTVLALAALGVVFGDIGTSPLYALPALFGSGRQFTASRGNVYGIVSMIIWAVTLVVSIKYVTFVMRADNQGEGGIMALVAQLKSGQFGKRRSWLFVLVGLIGIALFFGDSTITPAISVLSAVEGLKVVTPQLQAAVLPVTLVILTLLFALQKYGTGTIGKLFGPVMLLWFAAIAAGGLRQIAIDPSVLITLSPLTAAHFILHQPLLAFTSLTVVVLAITGAEALYADMGHFGRRPIRRAWFLVVFPATSLCYMGEAALLVHQPHLTGSLLVQLYPAGVRWPMIVLATAATLIASQAVIAGTFSLTRQAIQLEFLPKMLVRHTSLSEEGQIYLPLVNFLLFVVVILLVVIFGSSVRLANAYGMAVSGTLLADTLLFLAVCRQRWRLPRPLVAGLAAIFLAIDLSFVASNAQKLLRGGIVPLIIAALVFAVIDSWTKGERLVDAERRTREGSLKQYIDGLAALQPPLRRLPGVAIYIAHHAGLTPLALRATIDDLHELPAKVIIVTVQTTAAAHVPFTERASYDDLGRDDGIGHLLLTYGYHDVVNIPQALVACRNLSPDLDFDPQHAAYFVSQAKVVPSGRHHLAPWRKSLYSLLARGALSSSDYYKLPLKQTEEMQSLLAL